PNVSHGSTSYLLKEGRWCHGVVIKISQIRRQLVDVVKDSERPNLQKIIQKCEGLK
ncbi:hypothetical protein HPP92_029180, partial [Vanilla planifolia]